MDLQLGKSLSEVGDEVMGENVEISEITLQKYPHLGVGRIRGSQD